MELLPYLKDVDRLAFRPEGKGYSGGVPTLNEPRGYNFEVDHGYFDEVVWPALAHRFPQFEKTKCKATLPGLYDQNDFDGNPIIGPWDDGRGDGCANFYLAAGFSGHGLMHAPACGRALSELLLDGRFETLDLARLGWRHRSRAASPIRNRASSDDEDHRSTSPSWARASSASPARTPWRSPSGGQSRADRSAGAHEPDLGGVGRELPQLVAASGDDGVHRLQHRPHGGRRKGERQPPAHDAARLCAGDAPGRPKSLLRQLHEGYGLQGAAKIRVHKAGSASTYRPAESADWRTAPDGVEGIQETRLIERCFPSFDREVATVLHIRRAGDISGQQLGSHMLERIRARGGRVIQGRVIGNRACDGLRSHGERRRGVVVRARRRRGRCRRPLRCRGAALLGETLPVTNVFQQKIAFEDVQGVIDRRMPFAIDLDGQVIDWTDKERRCWPTIRQPSGWPSPWPARSIAGPTAARAGLDQARLGLQQAAVVADRRSADGRNSPRSCCAAPAG